MLLWPINWMTWKAASFEWDPEQEKALQQFQPAVQAALPLGPYDPADPIMLEVSVADRDAVRNYWQSSIVESQLNSYRFITSPAILWDNYFPSEKSLLAYYLAETEHLTMGHQVTVLSHVHIMSWLLSNLPNHKVGHAQ